MKNVCIIGNSHLGAIKDGASRLEQKGALGDVQLTFFGSPNNSMESCVVQDGVVHSANPYVIEHWEWTSGGKGHVDLGAFDEILFVLGKAAIGPLALFARDSSDRNLELPPHSSDMISTVVRRSLNSWHAKLAFATARDPAAPPVSNLGVPSRSAASPFAQRHLSLLTKAPQEILDRMRRYHALVQNEIDIISGEENVRLYVQPSKTREIFQLFTRQRFSIGSKQLSKTEDAHGANDFVHMNAHYGEMVLKEWLQTQLDQTLTLPAYDGFAAQHPMRA